MLDRLLYKDFSNGHSIYRIKDVYCLLDDGRIISLLLDTCIVIFSRI